MPVGNSDRGVGLWAGQIMFGLDNSNQYIDWWHEAIPGSGEGFDHEGTLTSVIINPSLTIGLSNFWNITINKTIGRRTMTWDGDTTTHIPLCFCIVEGGGGSWIVSRSN